MVSNSIKHLFTAAILVGAASISGNVFSAEKGSQDLIDARQETQIWTTYQLSQNLRNNNLEVSVEQGKATITGEVEEDIEKDLAQQIALGVNGIKDVDNKITVNPDYKPKKVSSSERSYGQMIDDASTTAIIKSKLLWSKNSEGLATNIDTNSGKVTLNGTAPSEAAKELAGRLAKNTNGVNSVDNRLTIEKQEKSDQPDQKYGASKNKAMSHKKTSEPSDDVAGSTMKDKKDKKDKTAKTDSSQESNTDVGEKISDGWITTKVKSTYMYSNNVDSSDISVSTNQGLVTLSGKVTSGVQHELAIEIAENIRGVKSVESGDLTY